MKKLFIIILLAVSLKSFSKDYSNYTAQAIKPTDTTVLTQILTLPLSTYIGKPVDSLLSVLPTSYTLRGFMVSRLGYTKGIVQAYSTTEINDCDIEIYIDTFQFQTFPNYDVTTWNMTLAKQETISYIRIMKKNNTVCVYGCNNPRYHYLD